MNTEEFRDLLQANAQAPRPVNPARTNQIEHRIKRRRTQRKALAGLTATAVAIAITGVWTGTRDATHSPTLESASPTLGKEFVADDGAVYHRVSLTTLAWPRQKTATVPLVRNGKPLAARVACAGKADVSELMYHFSTSSQRNFNLLSGTAGMSCGALDATDPIDLPDSVTSFTVSADKPTFANGTVVPDGTAAWAIALYEWDPPAKPKPAPPAPKMIAFDNKPLVVKKGVWPRTQELTLTVPYRGRPLMYNALCAGAIGGNAKVEVRVNGKLNPDRDPDGDQCYSAEGGAVGNIELIKPPRGTTQVTLTVKLTGFEPVYLKRPGSWSVGVFEVKNR